MAGKALSYVIAAVEIVAGIILLGTPFGLPLIMAGTAQAIGTALTPSPSRLRQLRDSPTYGIDRFDNPRGSEALVPILYGEHELKPAVILEAVREALESHSPGTSATREQEFRWLGVVCEGELADISRIRINDREVLSELQEGVKVGRGNGTRKEFTLPHRWVWLGDDEHPAVSLAVDGVTKSWNTLSAEATFVAASGQKLTLDVRRDAKTDRILGGTIRVFIRGASVPEFEQLPRAGVYRWTAQKVSPRRVKIRFKTRPPAGFSVRVTYDYLAADGVSFAQAGDGTTKVLFGTAPTNGAQVTASYRTASIPRLRIAWRPGTLDQTSIPGFTELEQSRNPPAGDLTRNSPLGYSTTGRAVDNLRVGLTAPRGLIQYKADGGTEAVLVRVRIEYRVLGATRWTTLRSGSVQHPESFALVGERPSVMRWEIDVREELAQRAIEGDDGAVDAIEAFERDAYELQVTRLTALSDDSLVADELQFSYVTEVLAEAYSYPGTALLAIRGRTGAFLAGSSLRVSCVARRAPLYDPRPAGGDRDIGSSQNAALAIRDLVTSSEGAAAERFGGGYFFAGSDFVEDANGLSAFADWCDAWVHRPGDDATRPASATNGERRCRLNLVLDTPGSLMEAVADMAFVSYAFATLQGAAWRFPLDRVGEAVFAFVDDVDPREQNATNVIVRLDEWGKTPTAVDGSFWNEELRYERDQMTVPVDALAEDTPPNVREVDLRGITRETEAARILRHLAEQAREMPWSVTWDAHPGAQLVEAGDIVTLRTRVPYTTGTTATELEVRVLAGVVARDDAGVVSVRYAGRVIASNAYALATVTVPATAQRRSVTQRAAGAVRNARRRVTGLRARIR